MYPQSQSLSAGQFRSSGIDEADSTSSTTKSIFDASIRPQESSTPLCNSNVVAYETLARVTRLYTDLQNRVMREKTFDGMWFPQMTQQPEALAKEGFYYIGPGDRVKAVCCDLTLSKWKKNDSITLCHKIGAPHCQGIGKPLQEYKEKCTENDQQSMVLYQDRRKSFINRWPVQNSQTPEAMAQAGFYYKGPSDLVKCHCCNIEIMDILPSENIIMSHLKWCENKGIRCDYINANSFFM